MGWIDAMANDGVRTWLTAERFAAHADGRDLGPVPFMFWRRYARPSDLHRAPDDGALLVLERATDTFLHRLDNAARPWALLDGRYSLPALGRVRQAPTAPDPVTSRRPPDAVTELALLTSALPDATHAELAAALGTTRSRVTQMLNRPDRPAPVPGPTAGFAARWWSDAEPWEQARASYEWLERNNSRPVLGGETAADAVAPWRTPASAVVHVRKLVPPPPGFVPADSPETATVTVVVDYRPAVLAAARLVHTPVGVLRVAHPLHIAADLHDTATVDERAAEQRDVLLARSTRASRPKPGGFGPLAQPDQEGHNRAPKSHVEVDF